MRNVLIVISGPSGVGKGTIVKQLVNDDSHLSLSISCTTRLPRIGEDNKDYFFMDKAKFDDMVLNDGFLEYSEHFENFYGTPKNFVFEKLENSDVLLEIDVNGGLDVKKKYPQSILIFIAPPSVSELKERLMKRNTESIEEINLRMERILYETEKQKLYDYVVVNDDLDVAINKIKKIIKQEKNK